MRVLLRDPRVNVNALDGDSRTPLFYAHSLDALKALLEHKDINVNVRDAPCVAHDIVPWPPPYALTPVMFRITFSDRSVTGPSDLSLRDQIRHIVTHPSYDHKASVGTILNPHCKEAATVWPDHLGTCAKLAVNRDRHDMALICHAVWVIRRVCPKVSTPLQVYKAIEAFEVR